MVKGSVWLVSALINFIFVVIVIRYYKSQTRKITEIEWRAWFFTISGLLFLGLRAIFDFLEEYYLFYGDVSRIIFFYFMTGFLSLLTPLCFVVAIFFVNKSLSKEYTLSSVLINSIALSTEKKKGDFVSMLKKQFGIEEAMTIVYIVPSSMNTSLIASRIYDYSSEHDFVAMISDMGFVPPKLRDKTIYVNVEGPPNTKIVPPSNLTQLFSVTITLIDKLHNPLFYCNFLETAIPFNDKNQIKKFLISFLAKAKASNIDLIFIVNDDIVDKDIIDFLKYSANTVYECKEVIESGKSTMKIRGIKLPNALRTGWHTFDDVIHRSHNRG